MDLFTYSGININSSFQRSTRIDNELTSDFLKNYIFHDTSRKVLDQISNSITNTNQSAFTLTGAYGTGKSSLALFLKALISKENKIKKLAEKISGYNPRHNFYKTFSKNNWFILNLIGSKVDPLQSISYQIDETLKSQWISKSLPPALKTKTKPTVASIIKRLNNISRELKKKNYSFLFLIDEMGKFLDFASSVGSDLNLFQEIAEDFSNMRLNKEGNSVFIGILHQPFEEYAQNLGRTVAEDWEKIQGRFENIPFSINQEETVHLIAKAISQKKIDKKFLELSNKLTRLINNGKINKNLSEALSKCSPIHPLVSLILNPISRQRFGQNERSIFTFLNSGEPFGFMNFLNDNKNKDLIYSLDLFFDYLQVNLEPSILVSNIGKNWSEGIDSLRRAEVLDDEDCIKLTKVITLIDLFGKNISLLASKEILQNSLNITNSKIEQKLKKLEDKKIIIFRKFKNAYSLFSGSDINLDELSELNKSKIKNDYDIILSQLPILQPIVAKRHFFEKGIQRIYQRYCLVLSSVKKTVEDLVQLNISNFSAGAFVFVCKSTEDTKEEFQDKFSKLVKIKFPKPFIFGFSENYIEFFNYALEIASLKRVRTSYNAIESDNVAKKELAGRLNAYQNLLFNSLYVNFEKANWYFNGKNFNKKNLSSISSDVSDVVYYLTPKIHNELIVRDKLSTMAVSGCYNLIYNILNNSSKKNLNMTGYPAEYGIYLSVLKSNKLHKIQKGEHKFVEPEKSNIGLKKLYDEFNKYIKSQKDPVSLSSIYKIFRERPFGLKNGLIPILLASFYMADQGSFALYNTDEQGKEYLVTEYDKRLCERFIHTPETLRIMYVKIEGEKRKLLDIFKTYVETSHLDGKKIDHPTPLSVLKPLVVKAFKLPAYVRKTRSFKDKRALLLRDELLTTKNPFELLYHKIPNICQANEPNQIVNEFDKIYFQLDNAYKDLIKNFKKIILNVFKTDPNISETNFEIIKSMAIEIGNKDPFSSKASEFSEDKWIEHVISFCAAKPANEWSDNDYNESVLKIEEMVRHFIMSYRLYTLRKKHSNTKIIDIAIFEGSSPERSSKFYKFINNENNSVEKISNEILKLLEDQKLSESEKGEVVLKVLRKIMNFKNNDKEKTA